MKKVLLVFLALTCAVTVFARGAGSSSANNYMRLTWWGNTVRDEQTLRLARLFESKNPGVTIETETTGWGSYWDSVTTQAASGSAPDLMQQDYIYMGQWASRNQLLDLTPYVNSGVINVSQIPDSALASGRVDGKLYGIPLGASAFSMAYDPAILQRAGITSIDSTTWTLADFERIALQIFQRTGVRTLPFDPVEPSTVLDNFVMQSGGTLFSADGRRLGFTDAAIVREFWDVQLRLLDQGVLIPASEAFVQVTMEEDALSTGKSWVKYIWNTQIAAAITAAGRPLDLLFIPRTTNYRRPGTYLKPSMFFSITARAENPDLAARFLNFYLNDLDASNIVQTERGIPVVANVLSHLTGRIDANARVGLNFHSQAAGYSSNVPPGDPGAAGEVRALFRDLTVQVLNKSISSADAAASFITRANQILGN